MKTLISLIIPILVLISSCGKTYTCKCNGAGWNYEATTKFISKNRAEKWCEGLQDSQTPNCSLQ